MIGNIVKLANSHEGSPKSGGRDGSVVRIIGARQIRHCGLCERLTARGWHRSEQNCAVVEGTLIGIDMLRARTDSHQLSLAPPDAIKRTMACRGVQECWNEIFLWRLSHLGTIGHYDGPSERARRCPAALASQVLKSWIRDAM